MNNFNGERNRRRLLDFGVFPTFQYTVANYSTTPQAKTEMKTTFEEKFFANNLHLVQDPLKKNLANSVITGENKKTNMNKTEEFVAKEPETPQRDYYPFQFGITGIFTGVVNFMRLFQKQSTETGPHYDNEYDDRQMASANWHNPKFEVQNKNERDSNTNMDVEICRLSSELCEDKINRTNLFSEFQPSVPQESFIDAESDYDIGLFNESCLEYYCPNSYQEQELSETASQKVKTDILNICADIKNTTIGKTELNESMEIEKHVPTHNMDTTIKTKEIASSCEDKLSKLKALLQCRQNKNNESSNQNNNISQPVDIPSKDCDSAQDTIFGNEIDNSDLTSSFNEVSGKFCSSSVDSEDSFQIVFTDYPQIERRRISSDCESDDSFIVFEETPENCYTNNDVFGEDDSSDSEIEDSVFIAKLSPNFSRTFSDLTDSSLFGEDVVDYAVKCDQVEQISRKYTGSLLNEKRKLEKKVQPSKRVRFSTQPPEVHVMRVWAFAARQARAGHWERYALDRERFKRRIADVEMAVSWVLKPQHRSRIVFQRFMPWWNAEKRRELAEKKEEERMAEQKKEADQVYDENIKEIEKKMEKLMINDDNIPNEDKCELRAYSNVNGICTEGGINKMRQKNKVEITEANENGQEKICANGNVKFNDKEIKSPDLDMRNLDTCQFTLI